MITIKLSVYVYNDDITVVKDIQRFVAAVLFNADYRAAVIATVNEEKLRDLMRFSSGSIDIIILPMEVGSLGRELRSYNRNATLIYYTGSGNAIVDLLDTLPYAWAPFSDSLSFTEKILKAAMWATKGKMSFTHESKAELIQFRLEEIEYFESNYRIVNIHLADGEIKSLTGKLDDIQLDVPGEMFCRCHKSYLVNLSKVVRVDKTSKKVFLTSGNYVYASKALYHDLLASLSGGAKIELV